MINKWYISIFIIVAILAGALWQFGKNQLSSQTTTDKVFSTNKRLNVSAEITTKRKLDINDAQKLLGQLNPAQESSLFPAILLVKNFPSDAALVVFEDFSKSWLDYRIRDIDGENCDQYVEDHPTFPIGSDMLDDVCTLGFQDEFYSKNTFKNLSPAAELYLTLRQEWNQAGFRFHDNAKVAIIAEDWLEKYKDSSILFEEVDKIRMMALSKVFEGVSDGFMPIVDSENKIEKDAKQAFRLLKDNSQGTFSGQCASEILRMLETTDFHFTDEIHSRITSLLQNNE